MVKKKPEDIITMDERNGWPMLPQRQSGKLEEARNILRAYVTIAYSESTACILFENPSTMYQEHSPTT